MAESGHTTKTSRHTTANLNSFQSLLFQNGNSDDGTAVIQSLLSSRQHKPVVQICRYLF